MRALWTLASKDLLLLSRDPMSLFFIVAFPTLLGVSMGLLGNTFGKDAAPRTEATVLVVDEDGEEGARDFVTALDASSMVAVERIAGLEDGLVRVRRGEALGLVRIFEGFSETAGDVFAPAPPRVALALDPSRGPEGAMIQGALMEAVGKLVSRRMAVPGTTQDGDGGLQLIAIESLELLGPGRGEGEVTDRLSSGFDLSFPSAILWGVLGCVAGFAISIAKERSTGTFFRLAAAPIPRRAILFGKGLACAITALSVVVVLTAFGLCLGLQLGSPALFVLAALCVAFCFSGLMMALATVSRSENGVAGAGWGLIVTLSLFGGGMIPLAFMPPFMKTLSNFSPVKWGVLALEGAIWRGFDLADALPALGILLALGVAGYAVGMWRLADVES